MRIVAVSLGVQEALAGWGIKRSSIQVVQNGVDTAMFRRVGTSRLHSELGLSSQVPLVGAVGNLHPVKGYELLLQAAAVVTRRRQDVVFVVAGEGDPDYLRSLLRMRADLGLRERFHFLGFKKADRDLYSELSLLVSTASSEGLPLSFLEAMACEVPIVATENEGSTNLLLDNGCGVTVPMDDPVRMAEAILRVLSDNTLAITLGQRGREAVCQSFSIQRSLAQYDHLIDTAGR